MKNKKIKIGDTVEGIMGIEGGRKGVVNKITSERGRRIIHFVAADGTQHDTYEFNTKLI